MELSIINIDDFVDTNYYNKEWVLINKDKPHKVLLKLDKTTSLSLRKGLYKNYKLFIEYNEINAWLSPELLEQIESLYGKIELNKLGLTNRLIDDEKKYDLYDLTKVINSIKSDDIILVSLKSNNSKELFKISQKYPQCNLERSINNTNIMEYCMSCLFNIDLFKEDITYECDKINIYVFDYLESLYAHFKSFKKELSKNNIVYTSNKELNICYYTTNELYGLNTKKII